MSRFELACARFLSAERTPAAAKVHLIAIGEAGIPALHAAAFEPDLFESATVRRTLSAWSSLISAPLTRAQLTSVVHGALRWYDLPDLVTDKVRLEEPLDPATDATAGRRARSNLIEKATRSSNRPRDGEGRAGVARGGTP